MPFRPGGLDDDEDAEAKAAAKPKAADITAETLKSLFLWENDGLSAAAVQAALLQHAPGLSRAGEFALSDKALKDSQARSLAAAALDARGKQAKKPAAAAATESKDTVEAKAKAADEAPTVLVAPTNPEGLLESHEELSHEQYDAALRDREVCPLPRAGFELNGCAALADHEAHSGGAQGGNRAAPHAAIRWCTHYSPSSHTEVCRLCSGVWRSGPAVALR